MLLEFVSRYALNVDDACMSSQCILDEKKSFFHWYTSTSLSQCLLVSVPLQVACFFKMFADVPWLLLVFWNPGVLAKWRWDHSIWWGPPCILWCSSLFSSGVMHRRHTNTPPTNECRGCVSMASTICYCFCHGKKLNLATCSLSLSMVVGIFFGYLSRSWSGQFPTV